MKKNSNDYLTLKDLPAEERPRERLVKSGAVYLSNTELLAIIFGSGVKGESVLNLSQRLLNHFGSISAVLNASYTELISVKGIGKAKACKLLASFEIAKRYKGEESVNESLHLKRKAILKSSDAIDFIRSEIDNYSKEYFFVLALDTRNRLIGIDRITEGILTASLVHPRETFESAIRKHAAKIIAAHNHPSGDTNPSDEDIRITKRLHDAGKIMGIELTDHLIITKNSFYSFKENGLL